MLRHKRTDSVYYHLLGAVAVYGIDRDGGKKAVDKSVEIQQLPAYHVRVDSTLASLHLIIRQYTYALKIADNSCSNKRGLGLVSAEIHAHVYHSHRLRVAFGNEFLGRVRKYLKDKSLCCHTVAQDITPVPYCPGAVLGNDLPAIFLRNVDVVKNGEFLIVVTEGKLALCRLPCIQVNVIPVNRCLRL